MFFLQHFLPGVLQHLVFYILRLHDLKSLTKDFSFSIVYIKLFWCAWLPLKQKQQQQQHSSSRLLTCHKAATSSVKPWIVKKKTCSFPSLLKNVLLWWCGVPMWWQKVAQAVAPTSWRTSKSKSGTRTKCKVKHKPANKHLNPQS